MDREYRLLDVLSRDAGLSQRQVAKETGLSLGMVNLILGRLVKTGAIKVVNLNGRTARYLLTPAGMAEKSRRAYEYLFRTVQTFRGLRERTDAVIAELYDRGARQFVVHGEGEIADIAEFCLSRFGKPDVTFERQNGGPPEGGENPARVVLHCSPEPIGTGYVGVSVLERLVQSGPLDEMAASQGQVEAKSEAGG